MSVSKPGILPRQLQGPTGLEIRVGSGSRVGGAEREEQSGKSQEKPGESKEEG